jgi:cytosine deaminase
MPGLADAMTAVSATDAVAASAPQTTSFATLSAAPTRLRSAEEAAAEVLRQAQIAAREGQSYGVGGAIVENATGRIIHAYGNRVNGELRQPSQDNSTENWFFPSDPTNHGETQLVGWYYDNRAQIRQQLGYLPMPGQLTVVTSLDPCAMCAGTLLTAGFNVAVVAPDDSGGGVNWNSTGEFAHVPPAVQAALRNNFGYYKVTGVDLRANYTGGANVIYRGQAISEDVYQSNFTVFEDSVSNVYKIRDNRQGPGDLLDIAPAGGTPSEAAAIRQQLVNAWPGALSVKLPAENIIANEELLSLGIEKGDLGKKVYYRPTDSLYDLLQTAMKDAPGSKNALAMIDRFGNVLAVGVDTPAKSPIATSMMNVASGYSRWAFDRLSDASLTVSDMAGLKATPAYRYLSPVGRNTFIYLKAPTPNQVATLKDLGIFGNTNDGVLQYIEPPAGGTMKQLDDQVRAMPFYYSASEHVSAVQSVPPAARLVVTNLNDAGPGSLRAAINQANAAGRYRQITFAVEGTIRLSSALPLIRVPVSFDGRAAVANPFAPRFATDPRVAIAFGGRAGLRFAASATGSQVIGLALGGSGGFAISSLTPNLEITGNRFGATLAGAERPNRLGALGGAASRAVVTPPESPLVTLGREADVNRPLVFSGDTVVSGVRTDTVGGTIEVGLDPDGPGPLAAEYFTVDPASPGALTSAAIESALAGRAAAWRSSLGKQQGGSFVIDVQAATSPVEMFPVARLPADPNDPNPADPNELDPRRELSLTWLSQVGNTVTAEFSLAPANVLVNRTDAKNPKSPGNKALYPYLGKTWTVSFMVPAVGLNTDGQRSERAATIGRLGTSNVAVGFYAVADARSGSIGGLLPTDVGYAAAALQAARSSGLFFEGSRLPAAGRMRGVSLTGWDVGKAYGIVVTVGGDPATAVTTYERPPTGAEYQPRFRAFSLAGGRLAIGVEASAKVTSRDFADLVITVPAISSRYRRAVSSTPMQVPIASRSHTRRRAGTASAPSGMCPAPSMLSDAPSP